MRKEKVTLPLSANEMTPYTGDPKVYTKELLQKMD